MWKLQKLVWQLHTTSGGLATPVEESQNGILNEKGKRKSTFHCEDQANDDDDLLRHASDLNRDLSFTRTPQGVDSNVSAWSRPSVVAAHTANLPGFCTLRRGGAGFQDGPSQGRWSVCVECLIGKQVRVLSV